jgi:hypothetical protein
MGLQCRFRLAVVAFLVLGLSSFCRAHVPQQAPAPGPAVQADGVSAANRPADPGVSGCVDGMVVDQSGAVVAGALVKIIKDGQSASPEATTGSNGQFFIANIAPGAFQLSVTSPGFAPKTISGVLRSGEIETVPPIALAVASSVTEVQVGVTRQEVAQEQLKVEETQRVFGIVPNFYVTYVPNAAPLSAKQKFQLAERTVVDPFTLIVVAGTAGVEQWQNHFIGYGQGLQGYGKRFGANYADTVAGTFIGGAIFPALLKQDPRYFYKGTGTVRSRFLYAVSMSVICKGDNGRWQPNYSNVLGYLAAGGISNLYYPREDRSGADLTFENALIGIAEGAITNLVQEFIVPKLRRFDHRHTQQQ